MNSLTPDLARDYERLTRAVGCVPWSDRTLIYVSGRDRARFLHNLCTNDILKLSPGNGCEAFLCSVQGKVLAHLMVYCEEDRILLETVASQADRIMQHLGRYLIREDVLLHDASQEEAQLLIAGPAASGLCRQLFRLADSEPGWPDLYLQHRRCEFNSMPCILRRVGFLGPESFVLQFPRRELPRVLSEEAMVQMGVCRAEAAEIIRVEHGVPWYGLDISDRNLPQEVGRDALAISFNKGCYLGQETVARIDALGHVNWQLVGVRCTGDAVPSPGTRLERNATPAGQVTSAVWSPRGGGPLALALLRREAAAAGTRLQEAGGGCQAEVTPLPLP